MPIQSENTKTKSLKPNPTQSEPTILTLPSGQTNLTNPTNLTKPKHTIKYLLDNIKNINLNEILVDNIYTEDEMKIFVGLVDLKTLVRNNMLSDDFLDEYIYPYTDDNDLLAYEIDYIVRAKRNNK